MRTYGDEVIDFMTQLGRPPDPWQADIVRSAFGVQDDGLWSAYELMVWLARQNGKGYVTDAIELAGLFLFRDPLILHSAHLFKASRATFQRLVDIVDANDWLSRRVAQVSRSKGDEGIYLTPAAGGGSLQFIARTLGSGRSLTGARNIFDEAYALTVGQFQAQTPTLSTVPNPQIVYTSTPPDEETGPMPDDAMLPSVRRRGHSGEPRVACFEWSPPEPGHDPHDVDVWYACNPALGIRISEWFLGKQLKAFDDAGHPEKFSTEHLGAWPPDPDEQWQVIPERDWQAAADSRSVTVGTVAFAVEMSVDRRWTCIAVGGRRVDGLRHGEVVESRQGSGWVVDRVVELVRRHRPCAVMIRPHGPAGSLIPDLAAAGVELVEMSVRDEAQAAGAFYDGICGEREPGEPDPRNVRHIGQGVLTVAVAGVVKRPSNTAFLWEQRSKTVDVSPLVAVTNALFGHAAYGRVSVVPFNPAVAVL